PLDRHLTADHVGEGADPFVGRAEADRARPALARQRDPLVGRERAALAVVPRRPALGDGGVVALLDLFLGAVALVGVAPREQAVGRGQVEVEARALEDGTLVPVEAEPAQRVLDADDPLLAGA